MSVNPTPWDEQLSNLEPAELDALEPKAVDRGLLATPLPTVDEDEDVTFIETEGDREPATARFPWAGLLISIVFWASLFGTLHATGAIR